ncbi:MAG: ComEC/Rec2 family competence protein [Pseudomonadota bacterium]
MAARILDAQRGALFPWVPVAFGIGIGAYFALRFEPGPGLWLLAAALSILLLGGCLRFGQARPLLIALLLILAGLGAAALRTELVAEPVLGFRYHGAIEGRVIAIDRSASDKMRLTLDRVVLERVDPKRTPSRVRVSLHGLQGFVTPEPGLTVILTGHLAPPEGPVEPGGFDFQRQAWFKRLGAVGYTRTPVLALAPAEEGRAGLAVHRLRMRISAAVQNALPGRAGAFAAAITTGDRSGMDAETLEDLRKSNLAHLLAISGLHMGMLTGFVFSAVRYGLALIPWVALHWPLHKIGAVAALGSGAVYLALSGGSVATERAYIMVAVMLAAVLFDRRALTIRAVALAALIVLTLRPEVLAGPGFQMSFAATTALIAVFGALRDTNLWRWHPAFRWVIALVVSSAIAGLATAPVAAAHFNRVPHYGLIANLLSVPLMGAVVMPAAVLAAVLAPLGLGWVGLAIMRPAIEWILGVAQWVAALDGAVSHVASPPPLVLPVLALGSLFVLLWQGRARWAGALVGVAALSLWALTERPDVLVTGDGGLIGVMTSDGRALSKSRGGGFSARSWLENDGDAADQIVAAGRPGFDGVPGNLVTSVDGVRIAHVSGRGAEASAIAACANADLVIAALDRAALGSDPDCSAIDREFLRAMGPLALYVDDDRIRFVTVRQTTGTRRWSRWSGPVPAVPSNFEPGSVNRAGLAPVRPTRVARQ